MTRRSFGNARSTGAITATCAASGCDETVPSLELPDVERLVTDLAEAS